MRKKKIPIKFSPFTDFDTCSFCGSHNGPFIWITLKGIIHFVCEECFELEIKKQKENPLG